MHLFDEFVAELCACCEQSVVVVRVLMYLVQLLTNIC